MPQKRITGFGGGNAVVSGSVAWEYVASNKELARRVLVYLEDRRVLYGFDQREDYESCRRSAQDIRNFLTQELMNVAGGGMLEEHFNAMRTACRSFVSSAGQKSESFKRDHEHFLACLQSFRDAMGSQIGWLASDFQLALGPDLASIVPPPDPRPGMAHATRP